jgi:hypothetical protein
MIEAVGRVGDLDRRACRRHVEERFSSATMADGYLAVYDRIARRERLVGNGRARAEPRLDRAALERGTYVGAS